MRKNLAVAGMLIATASSLSAATLNFSHVRNTPEFVSMTTDLATGQFYERQGYGYSGQTVQVYANQADFDAGIVSSSVGISGGYYGTYVAANNGALFGRTSDWSGTSAARWDLADGSMDASVGSFPNMLGDNFYDTYNWGGFSGVNFYQDQTGLYVLGHDTAAGGQTWQLSRLDSNLNILETKTFTAASLGFGVMINGSLFTGSDYYSTEFNNRFDFASGTSTAVDFDIVGAGGNHYIDNLMYDMATDTLYLHNLGSSAIYRTEDISVALGVGGEPVPEVGTYAMFAGALLVGREILRRRKV